MRQDLDAQKELASNEVELASLQDVTNAKAQQAHSELPLFAAADQLKKQERMGRYKFIAVVVIFSVVLLAVYLFMYDRGQVHLPHVENIMNPLSIEQKSDQAIKASNDQVAAVDLQKPANLDAQVSSSVALKINLEAAQNKPQTNNVNSTHGLVNRVESSVEAKNKASNNKLLVETITAQEPVVSVVLAQNTNASQQVAKVSEVVEQNKLSTKAPDKKLSLVKQVAEPSVGHIDAQTVASARRALQKESVLTVINSLKQSLDQHEGLIETSKLYISLLISSGQYAQAEQQLAGYRSQYKNELAFTVLDTRLLMALGKYTKALGLIEQQASLGNMSYELLSLQAAAYQSLQNWGLALQSYTELLRYDATQPRWWLGLAIAHDALGNKGKAKQAYQRVILDGGLEIALQNYAKSRLAQL